MFDCRRGSFGRFAGHARFEPDGGDLAYDERGRLRFAGHDAVATRRYLYRFPVSSWAAVAFADGRPFYTFALVAGCCALRHDCGDDCYQGWVGATGRDEWRLIWRVTGPRKDLLMRTRYRRADR